MLSGILDRQTLMMRQAIRITTRILIVATFAMWFGGFGFYTAFVVPTGTEVLGSSFEQGMITRRVTRQLNLICALAVLAMLAESWLNWSSQQGKLRAPKLAIVLFILAMWVLLVRLHPAIDSLIDQDAQDIDQYAKFYRLHRAYLWTSTLQWLAGWGWLAMLVIIWGRARDETPY